MKESTQAVECLSYSALIPHPSSLSGRGFRESLQVGLRAVEAVVVGVAGNAGDG
jgi:hypothetical protein